MCAAPPIARRIVAGNINMPLRATNIRPTDWLWTNFIFWISACSEFNYICRYLMGAPFYDEYVNFELPAAEGPLCGLRLGLRRHTTVIGRTISSSSRILSAPAGGDDKQIYLRRYRVPFVPDALQERSGEKLAEKSWSGTVPATCPKTCYRKVPWRTANHIFIFPHYADGFTFTLLRQEAPPGPRRVTASAPLSVFFGAKPVHSTS